MRNNNIFQFTTVLFAVQDFRLLLRYSMENLRTFFVNDFDIKNFVVTLSLDQIRF